MSHRCSPQWAIVALALALVAGCAAPQALPAPTSLPAGPAATPTAEPAAPATPAPSYEGWQEYTDQLYGFSLRFPAGWTAELDRRDDTTSRAHLLWLRPPVTRGQIVLSIGFKRVGEEYGIQRTGVGSGDLVTRGTVPFLGEDVTRWVLVAEGKDMSVLYDQACETQRGDMVFTLALDYAGLYSDPVTLPEDVQAQADMTVASFRLAE